MQWTFTTKRKQLHPHDAPNERQHNTDDRFSIQPLRFTTRSTSENNRKTKRYRNPKPRHYSEISHSRRRNCARPVYTLTWITQNDRAVFFEKKLKKLNSSCYFRIAKGIETLNNCCPEGRAGSSELRAPSRLHRQMRHSSAENNGKETGTTKSGPSIFWIDLTVEISPLEGRRRTTFANWGQGCRHVAFCWGPDGSWCVCGLGDKSRGRQVDGFNNAPSGLCGRLKWWRQLLPWPTLS